MAHNNKTVIILAGPTAVGKTAVAIDIANYFSTEIISADSRQCYKELHIGVARPSEKELAAVKHYFIASHSIHDTLNAVRFENYALQKAAHIFERHDVAVMVGGTGLYIKAFTEGLDEMAEVPASVRQEVIAAYNQKGMEWLQQEVLQADPAFYKTAEVHNPHRLLRALEVWKATGRSILSFRKAVKAQRPFKVIKIALNLPKEELHKNITGRVDKMFAEGLAAEVQGLLPYRHLNALQTVGYKEMFAHFNGHITLAEATDLIKTATRQYAKRQLTWFKKDESFLWQLPHAEAVLKLLQTEV